MLARIEQSPWAGAVHRIGDPTILVWLIGAVLVLGGICLALGMMTRLTALLLFVTLIPITISGHVAPGHVGPLLKNVAILGGHPFLCSRPGFFCSAAGCKVAGRRA
jgi:putative oxidoreductase